MTSKDLIALLQDAYREKVALRDRHVAGAALVPAYDFNNTYQYVIGREEHHVRWDRLILFLRIYFVGLYGY